MGESPVPRAVSCDRRQGPTISSFAPAGEHFLAGLGAGHNWLVEVRLGRGSRL
jgi:hypothetical protein